MMDISYELIQGIFNGIFSSGQFQWVNYSVKFLAISFFMLTFYSNMITSRFDWGEARMPFDRSKLFNSIVVVLLIISYDRILVFMDDLLGPLDQVINDYSIKGHIMEKQEADPQRDMDVWDYMKMASSLFIETMVNPFSLFAKLLYVTLWILDNVVYGLFLVERFFFLTCLKILGPIAFCVSFFEKGLDTIMKWCKLYAAYYLLVIPFFLVIYVTNEIYIDMTQRATENDPFMGILPGYKNTVFCIVLFISVYLKFKLFKKSTDVVYKLFA